MFDKFFKKIYKSRKSVSEEEAKELNKELERLKEDVTLREAQVIKLARLLHEDPGNSEKYAKRLNIHNRIILDNKQKIQEIEIKLLDS
tara:strand:+ start:281 stop:544 length:264 start_codon:yes stop_codon:yes gene_type:complete